MGPATCLPALSHLPGASADLSVDSLSRGRPLIFCSVQHASLGEGTLIHEALRLFCGGFFRTKATEWGAGAH